MRDGNEWVLVGEKTCISNGGIADFYVTFARTGEGEGRTGLSAFIVPAERRSTVAERIDVIAPHPLARLDLRQRAHPRRCDHRRAGRWLPHRRWRRSNLFRVTVGAAALGFARRALDEALASPSDPHGSAAARSPTMR